MKTLLQSVELSAAISGITLCLVAVGARAANLHYLLGLELMTLFIIGIALMVAACLAKLHLAQ